MTYEEYLEACNSSPWKDFQYGEQRVTQLTKEEYEALSNKTQETK